MLEMTDKEAIEVVLMAVYCPVKDGLALYPECKECEDRLCEAFYCLVVGSRTFDDYELMKKKLDHILKNYHRIVIVSGGARGADSLAERYAKEKDYPLKVFPAEWDRYGKSAGYRRNEQMHQYISKSDHRGVVAFWKDGSKGTAHNFGLAEKYNNQLRIIKC